MKLNLGTTRMVVLFGAYAVKMPIVGKGLKSFLKGWIGNVDERRAWKRSGDPRLCPTSFSMLGLVNFMKRTEPIEGEFDKRWILAYFKDIGLHVDVCSGWKNFGLLNGRLVMIDYAVCRESSDRCSNCDDKCSY